MEAFCLRIPAFSATMSCVSMSLRRNKEDAMICLSVTESKGAMESIAAVRFPPFQMGMSD